MLLPRLCSAAALLLLMLLAGGFRVNLLTDDGRCLYVLSLVVFSGGAVQGRLSGVKVSPSID